MLLAEPLSSGSQQWFNELQNRSRTKNNLVVHLLAPDSHEKFPDAFRRSICELAVPSPLLCGETRAKYLEAIPQLDSVPNNVLFLEINKPDEVLKLIEICHFYIYVSADLSNLMDALPKQIQKKILLTVVDNTEFTPRSTEATPIVFRPEVAQHVVKINSLTLLNGIEHFFKYDVQGASTYFDSLQQSNILEVAKYFGWFLRTENLRAWLLALIKTEIATNKISEARIEAVYTDLKLQSLVECSRAMHAELQKEFVPQTDTFFASKLSWWMLYFRNDNVEYTVKDYLNTHFMPKSIDSYNYLKGQLVARLQEQKFAHYTENDRTQLKNPLQEYKTNLINVRVPQEIQLAVYAALSTAFVYYQLPLTAISILGYLFFGIQAQTAAAITTLGWVLGFNKVSKDWNDFSRTWLTSVYEEVRVLLSKDCIENGLLTELNLRYDAAQDLAKIKRQVLEELNAAEQIEEKSQN